MQYRDFGSLDFHVSALGFGTMRLPTGGKKIDREQAVKMIRYAIDHGVNYVDTAWPYHEGESEIVVGEALQDGYRQRVKLATKLPLWSVKDADNATEHLDKQLEKLQTDHIDCYLLHSLNHDLWEKCKKLSLVDWIVRARDEGKINYIGFSFHDDYDLFQEIIDFYNWDFCQIQYNYVDTEFQAGRRGLQYAANQGVAVVIMEPLRGGNLADKIPAVVRDLINESGVNRTPVDLALQWLWNQPEVSVVLSGMSNMQQVVENVESASNSGVNTLTEKELEVVDRAADAFRKVPVKCTACGYCLPCPNGVKIPGNFQTYNEAKMYNLKDEKREVYMNWPEAERASGCVACRQCEDSCPQNLKITDLLKDVAAYFAS